MKRGQNRAVSKVKWSIHGKPICFELRRDGLHVRPRYGRRSFPIQFQDLYDIALGQKSLPL